jgi:hypothetical protein
MDAGGRTMPGAIVERKAKTKKQLLNILRMKLKFFTCFSL